MLQLYGHLSDQLSFSVVTKAIVQYVINRLHVPFTAHEIGTSNPTYDQVRVPIGMNSNAPVGICISYPPAALSWLEGHDIKILVTVCETDRIPSMWVQICNGIDLVVVPSQFCVDVFKRSGVQAPILLAPHGVDLGFLGPPRRTSPTPQGYVRLLHVSGAASFPQRKGTSQLLLAFRRVVKRHPNVQLILKVPMVEKFKDAAAQLGIERHVHFADRMPGGVRELLLACDATVQPSRGEGFGLVPLEGLCLGVPSIMTATTGHASFFDASACVKVETGPSSVLQTIANGEGFAPQLTVEAIEDALETFLKAPVAWQERAYQWAVRSSTQWAWANVLNPLRQDLKRRLRNISHANRPGDEASHRGLP